jgi:hypothetical protein
MAELATWAEAGPDPERDGVVLWRRRDLQHRANKLAISVFDGYDAIVGACCRAWNFFASKPHLVSSISSSRLRPVPGSARA